MAGWFESWRNRFFGRKPYDLVKAMNEQLIAGQVVLLGDDPDAGIIVTRDMAMEIPVVWACINALASDIG